VDAAVAEALAWRRQMRAVEFLGTIDFLPAAQTGRGEDA
jgi:hypothetical protein